MRIRVFSDATTLAEAAAADIARWLTIDDSRIVGNRTGGEGGGIFTDNSLLHLRSSRVSSALGDDYALKVEKKAKEKFLGLDHPVEVMAMKRED